MLEKGGSMVTRVSPDLADFSIVIEKMDSANSVCARGSNPSSVSEAEEVILILNASFKTAAGSHLQVGESQRLFPSLCVANNHNRGQLGRGPCNQYHPPAMMFILLLRVSYYTLGLVLKSNFWQRHRCESARLAVIPESGNCSSGHQRNCSAAG